MEGIRFSVFGIKRRRFFREEQAKSVAGLEWNHCLIFTYPKEIRIGSLIVSFESDRPQNLSPVTQQKGLKISRSWDQGYQKIKKSFCHLKTRSRMKRFSVFSVKTISANPISNYKKYMNLLHFFIDS